MKRIFIAFSFFIILSPSLMAKELIKFGYLADPSHEAVMWALKNGKVTEKINNLGYKCYDTEDFKIGYKSFLDKTKPKFKNK